MVTCTLEKWVISRHILKLQLINSLSHLITSLIKVMILNKSTFFFFFFFFFYTRLH